MQFPNSLANTLFSERPGWPQRLATPTGTSLQAQDMKYLMQEAGAPKTRGQAVMESSKGQAKATPPAGGGCGLRKCAIGSAVHGDEKQAGVRQHPF